MIYKHSQTCFTNLASMIWAKQLLNRCMQHLRFTNMFRMFRSSVSVVIYMIRHVWLGCLMMHDMHDLQCLNAGITPGCYTPLHFNTRSRCLWWLGLLAIFGSMNIGFFLDCIRGGSWLLPVYTLFMLLDLFSSVPGLQPFFLACGNISHPWLTSSSLQQPSGQLFWSSLSNI